VAKAIAGTELQAVLTDPFTTDEEGTWYLQATSGNTWQAENEIAAGEVAIATLEWGDNIARPWRDGAKVRIETVLHTTLPAPMQAYTMKFFGGQGRGELWGTNGVLYDSTDATVYTQLARLSIVQIADESGTALPAPLPVPDVNNITYSSEVNVQGKVIFGAQWNTATDGLPAGTYRVTISFQGDTNVALTGATANHGTVDSTTNTASVDVSITSTAGGGGGGGGEDGDGDAELPGEDYVEEQLDFRWNLLAWPGADAVHPGDALRGEGPASGGDDVLDDVTAVYAWDATDQTWSAYFPRGEGIPGANDLEVLQHNVPYWFAVDAENGLDWVITAGP
jgi:hypothetical protein